MSATVSTHFPKVIPGSLWRAKKNASNWMPTEEYGAGGAAKGMKRFVAGDLLFVVAVNVSVPWKGKADSEYNNYVKGLLNESIVFCYMGSFDTFFEPINMKELEDE